MDPGEADYAEWCRRHGKRRSRAGWEIWEAAYRRGCDSKLEEWDRLTQQEQDMVAALARELSHGRKR